MTCELRILSLLENLDKCCQYLFPSEKADSLWLSKSVVAMSPIGDRLIVAHKTAIVLLAAQWERQENNNRFVIVKQWNTYDALSASQDNVTCAIILPLAAVANHSQGGHDWSCIVVGFSSGIIRFFTENLDMIAEVRLQTEPVLQIKVTTPRAHKDCPYSAETIFVVYPSVMCNIPGVSLFQTLRTSRKEVALKRASADKTSPTISVEYKKFGFSEVPVRDACAINTNTSNNFDHLLSATIAGGFYCNYRPVPPQQTIFASTARSAWLQLDHSTDGVAAPLQISDVALTVISKLPGWLGLSSGKAADQALHPPPPTENLNPRCRLLDRRREGQSLLCSPDGQLLVVVDSLGRVTLVEARTGIAIRMWKGYRDAECGFLEVQEEVVKSRHKHRHERTSGKTVPRRALLLVIYVPKKGLIEIYPLRHGPRIVALRVKKRGRLLYVPHGILGNTTSVPSKVSSPCNHLVFLSEDGLMDLIVPFHCAVLDTSIRAQDMHFVKQLKLCLKDHDPNDDTLAYHISTILKQLKTDEVRLLAIDLLSSNRSASPALLHAAIDVMLETAKDTDVPQSSGDTRNILIHCKQLRKVVKFFEFLLGLPQVRSTEKFELNEQSLSELLQLSESEVKILEEFVKMNKLGEDKREGKVTFQPSSKDKLCRFLLSFSFAECGSILQAPKLSQEGYYILGETLYSAILMNINSLETWKMEAAASSINASVFAHSLVTYWLQRPLLNVEQDMRYFIHIMTAICSFSDEPVTSLDYNVESAWWTELRAVISQSRKTLNALATSVCCRAVSLICEQQAEIQKCENPKDKTACQEWETLSADTWQWDLLISRLEDVTMLNVILSTKTTDISDVSEVSLSELTAAGENAVSELTAKWLSQFRIKPHLLLNESDVEFQKSEAVSPTGPLRERMLLKGDEAIMLPLVELGELTQKGSEFEEGLLGKMELLKKRFPFSVTSSVIISHIGWELMRLWKEDLNDLSLFNLAIEYFLSIPSAHLKAAVSSLAWGTYIKVHFESITRLISKVGKLPTDTLCQREIGIARRNIADVMRCSGRLLIGILDACLERPQVRFPLRTDSLWNSSNASSGLISVAVSRPYPCEEVVLLHQQMTTTVHMVAALEIKDKAVLSALFDSLKNDLFGELTVRRSIVQHHSSLSDVLLSFLRRAISAAVQTIGEVETESGESGVDAKEAFQWVRVCMDLGSTWRVPLDVLRRHYVCELYSSGYDRLSEEALPGVKDTALLASQLLVVVGQRIKSVISTSPASHLVIASLSPSLTSWLNSLDDKSPKARKSTIQDTELIMNFILQHLPEHHIDANLATIMAECLSGLSDG